MKEVSNAFATPMTIEFILKFLGWAFLLVPTIVFLSISFLMIKGAGNDDALIRALSLIGLAIFLIGAITLVLVYLTDIMT